MSGTVYWRVTPRNHRNEIFSFYFSVYKVDLEVMNVSNGDYKREILEIRDNIKVIMKESKHASPDGISVTWVEPVFVEINEKGDVEITFEVSLDIYDFYVGKN